MSISSYTKQKYPQIFVVSESKSAIIVIINLFNFFIITYF